MELVRSIEEDLTNSIKNVELLLVQNSTTQLDQGYRECEQLLKQLEVEAINFISDDRLRLKVS